MLIRTDDLRFSLRQLVRNPGISLMAVFALALGIGANTAIFSVVNGVLLQPLPYTQPERLVSVYESSPAFNQRIALSYPDFLDWRRENDSFTDIAVFRSNDFNITGSGPPERLLGTYASAGLFSILGVNPILGRSFALEEDQLGADGVVMLSFGLWSQRFGADRSILGQAITLNGRPFTVIGVLPAGFRFRAEGDIYLPLRQWNAPELDDRGSRPGLYGVARLKPGVTLEMAQADLTAIADRLTEEYPDSNTGLGAAVVPMQEDLVGDIRPTLLLMLGAVGFLLIIACANVANLLLARSTDRRREFAIRTALGADRNRIIGQLLTESVLLGVAAGVVGLWLAVAGTRVVLTTAPDSLPQTQVVAIDANVLIFTLVVSVLTGVVFGVVPAFSSSSTRPNDCLKAGARASRGRDHRLAERAFVALQIGLSVVLLAGAGLLIQSVWRLWQVDPGFETSNLLTAQSALSPTVAGDPPRIRAAFRDMLARVEGIPGVESAAITSIIPLSGDMNFWSLWLGAGPRPSQEQIFQSSAFITTPGYLDVTGIPLLRGRFFTDRDTTDSDPVVVIDEVMAQQLFPNEDPIGGQISIGDLGPARIIGTVGHVKHLGLDSDSTALVRDQIYFPFGQVPDEWMPSITAGIPLMIRTVIDPLSVVSAVRTEVAGPTRDQPIYSVRTMEQVISVSLAERRFTMLLLSGFAFTALTLASIGIYGVISYSVGRRTHELGVRAALGATRLRVLRQVVGEGLVLAFLGLAVGVPAALGLTRLLANLLYGVQPGDPATLLAVSMTLAGVAFLASYFPARRATKVDPVVALRCE